MLRVLMMAAALALVGCAQQPKTVWIRTDGQTGFTNPALAQQFEVDKTICEGEMSKANMSGAQFCRGLVDCVGQSVARSEGMAVVGKGCMAQRGYISVLETEAEAKAAELRAAAAPPPAVVQAQPARRR